MKHKERLTQWVEDGASLILDNPSTAEEARQQVMVQFKKACIKLAELEDKIESGELVDRDEYLDYLMAAKDMGDVTDKEIEFFAKRNARVRENAGAEIARLTAENAELRARLDKAVELPCKVGDTVYYIQYFCNYKKCDSTTQQICCGCKEMIERERRNEKYVICEKPFELKDLTEIGKKYFTDRAEAEARLKELQGGER